MTEDELNQIEDLTNDGCYMKHEYPEVILKLVDEVRRLRRKPPVWDGSISIGSDLTINGVLYKAGETFYAK